MSAVKTRWGLALTSIAVGGAAGVVLYLIPPTEGTWYPRCQFHSLTGLHCPGCGATRAVHSLLHGDLAQAAAYNVVLIALLPFIAVFLGSAWFEAVTGRRLLKRRLPAWSGTTFAVLLVVFWILRNVPYYPFTLLAPHTL